MAVLSNCGQFQGGLSVYFCVFIHFYVPDDDSQLDVWVGVGFQDLRDTAADGASIIKGEWVDHPSFDISTFDFDIALIKLDAPAVLSPRVQTIQIAAANSDVAAGTSLLVSGWGKLSGRFEDARVQL